MTNTTFPDGSKVVIVYDADGRRIAQTDQSTNTTRFGYDALGRLTSVTNALNLVVADLIGIVLLAELGS